MKLSKLIWPLISIASIVMIIISLFLDWWVYTSTTDIATIAIGSYSAFSDFSGFENNIWSTIGLISLIIGAVGIVFSIIMSLIKLSGKKNSFKPLFLVASILALVGTVGFFVSEMLLTLLNLTKTSTLTIQLLGQFGLWMAIGALVIGTISVFMCQKDFKAKKHSKKRK